MFNNKFLNLSFIVGLVMVVAVVAIPGVGTTLFETQPLSWSQWLIAIGGAFLIVPMVELQKFIERKLEKRK